MQARYYDPVIGRFYSNDPVGYTSANPVMSFNRYLYVNNNPYKYTDPNGEFLDTVLDVGFILYDLGDMAINGVNETNSASLAANVAGALIPGATGLGLAARASKASKKSPCPLSCFVAGTEVLTKDGHKPIENVEVGDLVWAKNVETGLSEWKPVTHTWVVDDKEIYEIGVTTLEGNYQTIEATESHPFYVVGKGWVNTTDLVLGDKLVDDSGKPITIELLRKLNRRDVAYNFTVADFHTYFVTQENILVHNCGGRSGKQQKLRELADDDKVSSADRGWIKNEIRHIKNGNRKTIRLPRNSRKSKRGGTVLAHKQGKRAKDGHSYAESNLQDTDLHKLEHKHQGYK